jgi:hypothetical protein
MATAATVLPTALHLEEENLMIEEDCTIPRGAVIGLNVVEVCYVIVHSIRFWDCGDICY